METLAGEEGVENTAEGPTEGVVVPLDSEKGKGWYPGFKIQEPALKDAEILL